jgi:hypothetical protein
MHITQLCHRLHITLYAENAVFVDREVIRECLAESRCPAPMTVGLGGRKGRPYAPHPGAASPHHPSPTGGLGPPEGGGRQAGTHTRIRGAHADAGRTMCASTVSGMGEPMMCPMGDTILCSWVPGPDASNWAGANLRFERPAPTRTCCLCTG